jgi:hypothetical protein
VEKWITEHLEPIIFGTVAAWFAFTKWLVTRLYARHEARMGAIERRQDDHEHELKQVSLRLADKMDEHYRGLDGKIDRLTDYMMTRQPNQREGDKNGHS